MSYLLFVHSIDDICNIGTKTYILLYKIIYRGITKILFTQILSREKLFVVVPNSATKKMFFKR